ncbi:Rrf2 family transcriptional regulator, partial [Salmonella enterica]
MAFSWTEERMNYLRENAGKLSTREIADGLGTNITVIRNMAARLKLSLRIRSVTGEQVDEVYRLYESPENITVRNIATQTGLSAGA